MKKLLIIFLLAAVYIYGYEAIPYMFNDLVPYGISPDEVNQILVDANFAAVEAEVFSGSFYVSPYPDPDLVWFNPQVLKWVNIKFTTNDISELFKRDSNLLYFSYQTEDEFKCMTVDAESIGDNVNPVGQETKWAYKFFFHNDKLFAVSSRYQGDYGVEEYKNRNPQNQYAHPGYVMSSGLFQRTLDGFQLKYGGFHNKRVMTLDNFAYMNYGNYVNKAANTSLSVYYANYNGRRINFLASYIDNFRIAPIFYRFQNKTYENYFDVADVPVDIHSDIEMPEEDNEDEDYQ